MTRLRVLCGVVCLGFAAPATAGDILLPYETTVCANVFSPENAIDGPSAFVGFVRCADLCRATAKDCVKFTKDAFSCQNGLISDNLDYSKKECENAVDPATRKSCQVVAKTNADVARGSLQTDRDTALAFCDTWRTDCLTACAN